MPQACRVCQHPHVALIDAALLRGDSSYALAKEYSLSVSSIGRHRRDHLLTGKRDLPPEVAAPPETSDKPNRLAKKPKGKKLVDQAKAEAIREAQVARTLPAPAPTVTPQVPGQTVEDAPRLPAVPETDGMWKGRSQYATIRHIVGKLLSLAEGAEGRKENVTAVIAYKEAGNLVLKSSKQFPEKSDHEDPGDSTTDQDELLELIRKAKSIDAPPVDWEKKS